MDGCFCVPVCSPNCAVVCVFRGMWLQILNVAFCAAYNGPRYYQELKDRSMGKVRYTLLRAGVWWWCMCMCACACVHVCECPAWCSPPTLRLMTCQFTLVVCLSLGFCFVVYGLMAVAG